MQLHATAEFHSVIQWMSPVMLAIVSVLVISAMKEPGRRYLMAVLAGGAGSAYLSGGGFGKWEMAFTAAMAFLAYRGLQSYRFIGFAWLLHTGWDMLHHWYGNPILPFDPTSSLGCAIYDPVIAAWCFAGGPSVYEVWRRRRPAATAAQI